MAYLFFKNKTSFNGEDLNYNVGGAALGMMDLKKSSSSIIMTTMVGRAWSKAEMAFSAPKAIKNVEKVTLVYSRPSDQAW